MGGTRTKVALGGTLLLLAGATSTAVAGGPTVERASLNSFAEVPTLSTLGAGNFRATVNTTTRRIRYTLSYRGLDGRVQQAHIHLGRMGTAGGISVFLCTNLAGGPPGTPACPVRRGTVTGVATPADVIGPTDQGIGTGQFNAIVHAIRVGAAYVNVHTVPFPNGEIRGQVR